MNKTLIKIITIIKDTIRERIDIFMPHYYSYKNHEIFGNIAVIPNEWYRKIFKFGGYSIFPYKVNDEIKFAVNVDKAKSGEPPNQISYYIWAKMGDGSWDICSKLMEDKTLISKKAAFTGDTKFFIRKFATSPINIKDENKNEWTELFYEDMHSLTHYFLSWVGILITAILALIVGVAVGLILAKCFGISI
jgi:hypothetical protein